ncbi:MAG: Hsp20/alpha crystallin family protein [Gemmataceae bacterium]
MNDMALQKTNGEEMATAEVTRGFTAVPRVDIIESESELQLLADMPGVLQDNADVRFENGELTIRGRRNATQVTGDYFLRESLPRDYFRTFRISEEVDSAKIWAEMQNGVLTLHLPKAEKAKPRKISIKGSEPKAG